MEIPHILMFKFSFIHITNSNHSQAKFQIIAWALTWSLSDKFPSSNLEAFRNRSEESSSAASDLLKKVERTLSFAFSKEVIWGIRLQRWAGKLLKDHAPKS